MSLDSGSNGLYKDVYIYISIYLSIYLYIYIYGFYGLMQGYIGIV